MFMTKAVSNGLWEWPTMKQGLLVISSYLVVAADFSLIPVFILDYPSSSCEHFFFIISERHAYRV